MGFEETIRRADVIVIAERAGHKVDKGGRVDPSILKSKKIVVRILQVIKGDLKPSKTLALAYSSFCHGIYIAGRDQALLLLEKGESGEYDAVNRGCSFGQIPFRNGAIQINETSLSVEAFARMYLR